MTRERSHWGWGWADKFPDADTRRGFGEQAQALLGLEGLEPREPAPLDAIELPASRVRPPASLAGICSDDKLSRITRTYGRAYRDLVRGFGGDFSNAPDLVATPRTEAEVSAVLDWATDARVAVIPFGGGTSVVGGVEATFRDRTAVVSLDMRGLNRVLEVDPISRAARIQAGATGPVLEEQLAGHGFTLRHFPQSFEFSTLGGWIATRAGGHFATVYTHIDDLVESTRMLTPAGVMESRRLPGSGAGPSPDRMVLGSEGILGVITEAWMRVQVKPRWRATASVRFSDYRAAVEATRAISQSGLFPANCRLLDPGEAMINAVTFDGSSVLILGFESADHPLEPWMERALQIARGHGGECPEGATYRDAGEKSGGAGAAGSWRQSFIEAPYLQNVMVSLGVVADTFETACTWDRFDELHGTVTEAVQAAMQRVSGGGRISCRFTHVYPDGPAPYYTFLAPARRGGELEQWAEIKHAASEALLSCGATITHHHAVGRTHRPWYDRQRPEPFALALRAAKNALDPAGVLNPGVLLD